MIKEVIKNGYCVGCGGCAYLASSGMHINKYGEYQPTDVEIVSKFEGVERICPSLNPSENEDNLAKVFLQNINQYKKGIGLYDSIYAGYAIEGDFRERGTSGGIGTWMATELLKNNIIDGVIHVKQAKRSASTDPFFSYQISHTIDEVQDGSKTRYHVVEINSILQEVKKLQGSYLFIGVPCMAKAVRRLQLVDKILSDRITIVASLVCGHLKSINWTLSLAWSQELEPQDTSSFQYRTKGANISARAYVFRAWDMHGKTYQEDSAKVVGGKFNQGALMLPACEFCDDVVGETADFTIGDAWLPQFEADKNGTNLIISRNSIITMLLREAKIKQRLHITEITAEEAYNSQSGCFRQRGEGLSHRLLKKQQANQWAPDKRVSAGEFKVSRSRQRIYNLRSEITSISRDLMIKALDRNDYSIYANGLSIKTKQLRRLEVCNTFFNSMLYRIKKYFFYINLFKK